MDAVHSTLAEVALRDRFMFGFVVGFMLAFLIRHTEPEKPDKKKVAERRYPEVVKQIG